MKIAPNIIFRYESKIDGGTLFLFDLKNYKTFRGSIVEYKILKYIQDNKDKEEIINRIENEFGIEDCKNKIISFLKYLEENKFVIKEG
ncbi:Coenzyme PQQ synthesis protein D (PqqD) [Caloranaerobacter azorensis DSM 13643]|uniref:Coenzyme PQQ synthesis protein D (PqqD) n=1 Tax=Caloranaerobacter azorensis DSM 13643 TaxID=1121264 RepID=A0A1M5RHD9_9FIRM|nr:PqqD family protein [Caloranaerobacter azorensis]SHH25203.1 Coenzyme PQQ synthesis protein D (PqqD) [Caloranaerobacter azorensis DSM 13643]